MNLLLLGLTIGTIGKIVLGVAVLRVHIHILKEHKIDGIVLQSMKREQIVTIVGLLLIVIGYALEVYFYTGATNLLTCTGEECVAAVGAVLFQ
jgi:hypothetical protein